MKIYIFGNGNTSFADFQNYYGVHLLKYLSAPDAEFLVGDFRGVDTLAMEFLKCDARKVTVYHVAERPRYIPDKYRTKVSQWTIKGGYADDTSRDRAAIDACTHYLAVDFNSNEKRKSGTLKNIELCESLGKIDLATIGSEE